jgi:2-haloacid dehalogenase
VTRRHPVTRRQMIKSAGIGVAAAALRGAGSVRAQEPSRAVKALVFDTFGTVVDWRGSIVEEGNAWGKARGIQIDWARFADRWRAGYGPSMDKVRKGEMPWTNLDHLHRALLEDLLKEFNMEGLSEEEKEHWNLVWHRLKPWPDSVAGLTRLKKKYTISPLSNGNVALLADMGKHAGIPWDLILSAELARHYKPDREAYLTAVSLLRPQQKLKADIGDPTGLAVGDRNGLETAAAHQQQVQRLGLVERLASAEADGGLALLWVAGGEHLPHALPGSDSVGVLHHRFRGRPRCGR